MFFAIIKFSFINNISSYLFQYYTYQCWFVKSIFETHYILLSPGELQDLPPRTGCAALPVVHVTCWPVGEKPATQDATRASETYACPVYHSRLARQEVVMELDVRREGIAGSRWALRGLAATIRPY